VLVALPGGGFQLVFVRFKNVKTLGRQVVTVPDNRDLLDLIRAVAYTHRATLLNGQTHRFLLVGPSGKPYGSSGAFCNAMNAVFAAPLAKVQQQPSAGAAVVPRVGPNVLRKSGVTRKLPECKTPADKASLAAAFRHGLDAQTNHYAAATSSERSAAAVSALATAFAAVPAAAETDCSDGEEADDDSGAPSPSNEAAVFAVEALLQYRVRGGEHQYLVRWATGAGDDSWEPEDELPQACVREFWRRPATQTKRKADMAW
jgi:hypothetical protein